MLLKRIFDFYIQSSLHVAFSAFALVQITCEFLLLPHNSVASFVFFGTVVGYNFVKYDALARTSQGFLKRRIKHIALLSFVAFLFCGYAFFQLSLLGKWAAIAILCITLLYTLPFFPNRKNARNWKGIKIYIVTLSWVGATVLLPVANAGSSLTVEVLFLCVQRFLLVFVLVLIFEIIDLKYDDPHLQTVPQKIGVKATKYLGYSLLFLLCGLEVFMAIEQAVFRFLLLKMILVCITGAFLFYAHESRNRYYSAFWVESIPSVWWIIVILC